MSEIREVVRSQIMQHLVDYIRILKFYVKGSH